MDPKQGLRSKGANENSSKWSVPQPGSYKPDSSPAKPQTGAQGGSYAHKTANTQIGVEGTVNGVKSRY